MIGLTPFWTEVLLRVFRTLAVTQAFLVLLEHFGLFSAFPVNKLSARRDNRLGWMVLAAFVLVTGTSMLYDSYGTHEPLIDPTFSRAILWFGLMLVLSMRSASKACQPRLIWLVRGLGLLGGTALACLDSAVS